jgi:hypothetical protein
MDRNSTPIDKDFRPFVLTLMLAVFTVTAAVDIAYMTHIVGHILLMFVLGVLTVICLTCGKSIFFLNAIALVVILFCAGGTSWTVALLGVVLIFGARSLAVAVRKKSTKTSAVLTVCITVCVGYIAVASLAYAAKGNSLAPEALFEKLNGIFDSLKAFSANLIREYVNALPDEMLAYYNGITKELLLETSLIAMDGFIDMVQLILPGCFVFLVQAIGYISVASFERIACLIRHAEILPEAHWRLYPTQVSCVVYILVTSAYLLSGLFSSASTFAILMMNFWIALMPVMIACGCNGLILRLKHPRLRKSMIFILILFVGGCLFMPDIALSLGFFMLTFMGAQDVSLARTAEAAERKNRDRK